MTIFSALNAPRVTLRIGSYVPKNGSDVPARSRRPRRHFMTPLVALPRRHLIPALSVCCLLCPNSIGAYVHIPSGLTSNTRFAATLGAFSAFKLAKN